MDAAPAPRASDAPPSRASRPSTSPPKPHGEGHGHGEGAVGALALAALGVVYGDIGTSPLYALKECVTGRTRSGRAGERLGLLSLMFWSAITLVVSGQVPHVRHARDNQGEGGGLAMLAMLDKKLKKPKTVASCRLIPAIIIFGACLLYGEGIITPAISVLSAVEGSRSRPTVARFRHTCPTAASSRRQPGRHPITVAILVGLFAVQKRGTATIGASSAR
jgi:KUP system potassium uptake protein